MHLSLDLEALRMDFPTLSRQVNGHQLVYLDSAATALKPQMVIDSLTSHYAQHSANIHRGVHLLSEEATAAYEQARGKVARFLNAAQPAEIIFTSGTTAAINLVAQSFGARLKAGDEVLITAMEHHSNIVPWQLLAQRCGCTLRVASMDRRGVLDLEHFHALLSERTALVAMTMVANSLGTVNPVKDLIAAAHRKGVKVLLDAAQAAPHQCIDVKALDCDFLALSGHKVYGPTGIGVLYGKKDLLATMPPVFGGGDMIATVTFEKSTWNELPYKFEAGTPPIASAIGLGAAIDYVQAIGLERIHAHEHEILGYATETLRKIPGLNIIGNAPDKAALVSFTLGDIHPHDIGTMLDQEGIAVRTGHHCTQPVMDFFGLPATTRASFGLYTSRNDIDALATALLKIREVFA